MKEQAKEALGRLRLLGAARAAYRGLYRVARAARGVDRRLARRCFESAEPAKLHLGCGNRLLDGWLNTDLHPRSAQVARLDATRRFPFADSVFAFAYSEHLIEHVSFGEGAALLRECFRVLAPGGRIRVATPDLRFLTALHRSDLSPLQERYRAWAVAEMPGMPEGGGGGGGADTGSGFVINTFVRAWGHRVIYDEPMLRRALENAGFVGVTECGLNESSEAALRGLANEQRLPDGFLRLETLTLEGTKPAREAVVGTGGRGPSKPDPG